MSAVDPTQSFYSIQTMEQALAESIAPRRFNLLLLGTFALVALTLAVLGVYGVVAYESPNGRRKSTSAWRLAPNARTWCG